MLGTTHFSLGHTLPDLHWHLEFKNRKEITGLREYVRNWVFNPFFRNTRERMEKQPPNSSKLATYQPINYLADK